MDLMLGLARGLHMAGSYVVFGTMLLGMFLRPGGKTANHAPSLNRILWNSLFIALAAGIAWFLLQSAEMASASTLSDLASALPIVIESTRFGHLLILRAILLIVAASFWQFGHKRIGAMLGGITIVSEAWLDHGGAMSGNTGTLLLISAIVHLAAGAAWIGSLPALFLMIARLPKAEAAQLARRYSPMGIICVIAMIASATVQYIFLIGTPKAFLLSAYGRVALLKLAALGGLIALAALNRYRLAPLLLTAGARRQLLASISLEIALGITALLAAGLLLNLTPPTMAAMLATQQ